MGQVSTRFRRSEIAVDDLRSPTITYACSFCHAIISPKLSVMCKFDFDDSVDFADKVDFIDIPSV